MNLPPKINGNNKLYGTITDMVGKTIPDKDIDAVALHINERVNKPAHVSIVSISDDSTSVQYFESVPFDRIDSSLKRYFAVDGSYNSQEFYNGIYLGIYTAGYVCYSLGKQIRMNDSDDPVILGKSYFPKNILITNDDHRFSVFEEMMKLPPVQKMLEFFGESEGTANSVWGFGNRTKDSVCSSMSSLLGFCQEILEWSLLVEILHREECREGDIIFRDGTLRTPNIKQHYLQKIGAYARKRGVHIVAVTKNSPIKLELSSSLKKIDAYMEQKKKPSYPFNKTKNKRWQKLCCWFEVSDDVLVDAYPGARSSSENNNSAPPSNYSMFAMRNLKGGRGFGIFFVARLDYVEKLQNYDWLVVDISAFDAIPSIREDMREEEVKKANRDLKFLGELFEELTHLTQEHYILGYPYPLVEAHNFVTLKRNFNDEVVNRVKASLYQSQKMDHVDIENMFLDLHERF